MSKVTVNSLEKQLPQKTKGELVTEIENEFVWGKTGRMDFYSKKMR
ncbi:MAG: hypothetical protein AAF716_17920 [Cyanobacteria bacterium P01_D01_bin.1]